MTTGGEDEASPQSGAAVFLDTSVLIPATIEVHPSHEAAADTIQRLISQDARLFISHQVCREFLVVLTRQPIRGRRIDLEEALAALHPMDDRLHDPRRARDRPSPLPRPRATLQRPR